MGYKKLLDNQSEYIKWAIDNGIGPISINAKRETKDRFSKHTLCRVLWRELSSVVDYSKLEEGSVLENIKRCAIDHVSDDQIASIISRHAPHVSIVEVVNQANRLFDGGEIYPEKIVSSIKTPRT